MQKRTSPSKLWTKRVAAAAWWAYWDGKSTRMQVASMLASDVTYPKDIQRLARQIILADTAKERGRAIELILWIVDPAGAAEQSFRPPGAETHIALEAQRDAGE